MLRGLVTALRTLTILSAPGREAERFSDSLYWFSLVGLVVGTLEALLARLGVFAGWFEMAALFALGGGVVLTRGLHADGLADLADGFFGGRNREAALRIMKDPNVGSFGSLALILVMLFKYFCLLELARYQAFGTMIAGVMLARAGQVVLATWLPYARAEGGTATAFVEGAGWPHLIIALASAFVFLVYPVGFEWRRALFLIASALASALALGLLSRRKIGGVTGDVLGACSELTEAFVWFAAVLSIRFPFL
jgi:adenosylcobinamide-GDP ribazoletransferase